MPRAPQKFSLLKDVVEQFLALGEEAFLEEYPDALLVLDEVGETSEDIRFHTIQVSPKNGEKRGTNSLSKVLKRLAGSVVSKFVFPLHRQEGKFACIITVGRAANNDMRLNVPSLSKFHAYFTHVARDGCWYLSDANSSNGTYIDTQGLPPSHEKMRLDTGAVIRFGPDITAQFYEAADFWKLIEESTHAEVTEEPS